MILTETSRDSSLHWFDGSADESDSADDEEFSNVTHVPEVPSNHRVDEIDTDSSAGDSDEEDEECVHSDRLPNLRQTPCVEYGNCVLQTEITMGGEPNLSVAL